MVEDPWQPRISWQRLLREVFGAWWRHLLLWLGLAVLSFLLYEGISRLLLLQTTALGNRLTLAAIPCVQTLSGILFYHLALRAIFGKDRYTATFRSALRMFIPLLLLQVFWFVVSLIVMNYLVVLAVRLHGIMAGGYFTPPAIAAMTLCLVIIDLLIVPFTLLIGPVMLIERLWPIAALKRGWKLIAGRVSRSFILVYILLFSPMMLFALIVLFLPPMHYLIWGLFANVPFFLLVSPWLILASVILYRDLLQLLLQYPREVEEWAVEPVDPQQEGVSG